MLYVKYGCIDFKDMPRYFVHDIDGYFDGYFEPSWFQNDWAKRVIKEIDKSEVSDSPRFVDSPVLGLISYEWISGGAKQLIMMNIIPDVIYDGDNLGDNCWPLVLELSKEKDITISLSYFPSFNWPEGCQMQVIGDNQIISNFRDFLSRFVSDSDTHKTFNFNDIQWPCKINTEVLKEVEIDF